MVVDRAKGYKQEHNGRHSNSDEDTCTIVMAESVFKDRQKYTDCVAFSILTDSLQIPIDQQPNLFHHAVGLESSQCI